MILRSSVCAVFLGVVMLAASASAEPLSGEMSLGIRGIHFKDAGPTKAFFSLEIGSRGEYAGAALALGAANIDSVTLQSAGSTYRESVDYYPLEFNVKGFLPLRSIELGAGAGVSMNFLEYTLENETTGKTVNSKTNVLFGAQAVAEIKFLFPSTAGRDAFVALEYCYQYVDRTDTFIGVKDFSNYRAGIRLGGRF